MKRKYCLSFRKYLIIKEYDLGYEDYFYFLYARIFIFVYIKLGDLDDTLIGLINKFEHEY